MPFGGDRQGISNDEINMPFDIQYSSSFNTVL
jgi:hypothetical protein